MGCRTSFNLALFSFFLVSLNLQEAESCGRGWLIYRGFCYGFFKERKTWAEAQVDCHSMGGHLASIHNSEESDRVAQYISSKSDSNKNVWIGMHVPTDTNEWAWVDHTRIRYLAWKTGEPNNFGIFSDEECVQLVSELDIFGLQCLTGGEYGKCGVQQHLRRPHNLHLFLIQQRPHWEIFISLSPNVAKGSDFLRWNDAACSSQRPYLCKMPSRPPY